MNIMEDKTYWKIQPKNLAELWESKTVFFAIPEDFVNKLFKCMLRCIHRCHPPNPWQTYIIIYFVQGTMSLCFDDIIACSWIQNYMFEFDITSQVIK